MLSSRGSVAVAHQQEGGGFVRHIICGHKVATLAGQIGLKASGGVMMLVASILQGEKAGCIHEHVKRGHRE